MNTNTLFSVYPEGYQNKKTLQWVLSTKPFGAWTIEQTYDYIVSDKAKDCTEKLQHCYAEYLRRLPIMSEAEAKQTYDQMSDYKKRHFIIATVQGLFSYRNGNNRTLPTPYMPLDFDDLESEDEAATCSSG